eukprot:gene38753-8986_t
MTLARAPWVNIALIALTLLPILSFILTRVRRDFTQKHPNGNGGSAAAQRVSAFLSALGLVTYALHAARARVSSRMPWGLDAFGIGNIIAGVSAAV